MNMKMRYPINVMQVVLSLEYGGLEKVVINLAERLDREKFHTSICCLDKLGELAEEAKEKGIKVVMVKRRPGIDFFLPFRLAHILKKERVNLLHTHNMGPLFYGSLAAWLARVPIVLNTRHGRERKIGSQWIWRLNNEIITISEDAKKELSISNRINSEKIRVIYNGIETKQYITKTNIYKVKKVLNINSTLVIGTVARLSPEKDQFTLLEAFSKIAQMVDSVKLVIVGDGILRQELERRSKSLGIKDKVLFLGFRQNISEILSIFDVFVLSSLTEGIPLTLLEAMAAGKPVVATNVGGNPEVVVDGETGFLVPPKNPEKMAEAIITLLKNEELAMKMGEAGRKRVEEKFSLERMVREYEEIYRNLLKYDRNT